MRLGSLIAFVAAFATSVRAQSVLQQLAKQMPSCAVACITEELPKSQCATNLTSECLCTNVALKTAVAACTLQTCSVYETLQTKNVNSQGCGEPVRYKGDQFIIIGITGIIFAVVAFALRMAASLGRDGRPLGWDDATMAVVVALAIPPAVFAPMLVDNGLGRDIWTLKADQITNFLKLFFMGEIFYVLALGISKISILFSFLRVFPAKDFRMQVYGVMGLSVAFTVAFFFATTFQCIPVSFAWTTWDGLHEGRCNNVHLQGWISAGINIALDMIVMMLPLKHLWNLNMNLKKKIMVIAMFSVGIFVIFTSSIRLYSLVHFANSKNLTWDYVEAGYWSLIEIDVSIFCGCMPAHRMVFVKAWQKLETTYNSSKAKSTNVSGNSNSTNSRVTTTSKMSRTSVKPIAGDESDFIPLVDVENESHSDQKSMA
ncbi:hypothetical protein P153DRAFT_302951 [Dothidotthia symphoricarpi CBS 119687]|uniref:CFEM domain-containing protein n=1 Tax=Dothidotthia symphoricarpi CBS 119687 TaxID=1392245 RepID=A0A6A5ZYN7_9PLEO|nr:uncharacterized protein P153DRAFT_302951 [Dothidotthia symphoricarpi CBS 119687]KAF2123897.1 hypothetical protein P153DRAFT_302951 [Dothidotthia symphoricarpi CBS 119687]